MFVDYYYAASAPIYAYKTTLDANGGESEYDHLITVNTPYIAYQPFETILYTANECWFPNATREGYTCVGWSKDKNAVSGVWNIKPTKDETYYAVWKKDESVQHTHVPMTLPAVPATCTETGLTKGSYCATCGEILQQQTETPSLGHFYEPYRVVAPTCQKQGYTI
ncbi:MAG: hypothetical protein IJU73_02690, partial [Ruminococcus sp.]|nr:hypothetical protein [Ruminococcus sp.]